MASGESMEYEARGRRADGEYRWFLIRAVPMRDKRGSILQWYGVMIDIEDRKRAEQERESTTGRPRTRESRDHDGRADRIAWHTKSSSLSPLPSSTHRRACDGLSATSRILRKCVRLQTES